MLIVGHDPGVSGALVAVGEDRRVFGYRLIPIYKDKTRHRVSASVLLAWLRDLGQFTLVSERVGPMPHDTPTTAWTFGSAEASVLACVECLGMPIEFVSPQKWQRAILKGMPTAGREMIKKSAVLWARDHYPELRQPLEVKKNSGMADAACIAELGVRMKTGGLL